MKSAVASGVVGISSLERHEDGAQNDRSSPERSAARTPSSQDALSGVLTSIFGGGLEGATIRLLAQPRDSFIVGRGSRPHTVLGTTTTKEDGAFQFGSITTNEFESLRQDYERVVVQVVHPDGWFRSVTHSSENVFTTDSNISDLTPKWRYIKPPTVVTSKEGVRCGVVSAWQQFNPSDPTKQSIQIEATTANPHSTLDAANINNWVSPSSNTRENASLRSSAFSVDVPEQGIRVDYENVKVFQAKPIGRVIDDNSGTESPRKAIEKWHPKRVVNGRPLNIPAAAMVPKLYREVTDEYRENAKEQQQLLEFAVGASPVVGNLLQIVSGINVVLEIWDAGGEQDPNEWPGTGNALDSDVDHNERDIVPGSVNLESVSTLLYVPYEVVDESAHTLAVRGIWSGSGGHGRLGHQFTGSSLTYPRTVVGDTGWNSLSDVISLDGDGFLAVGIRTIEPGSPLEHVGWAVKLNSEPHELWTRTYRSPAHSSGRDEPPAMEAFEFAVPDGSGGALLIGWIHLESIDGKHAWAVKIDSDGEKQWEQEYSNDDSNSFSDTFADGISLDNGYLLVGQTNAASYSDERHGDGWAVRLDENGTVRWQRSYSSSSESHASDTTDPRHDEFHAISPALDGGYLLAGEASPDGSSDETGSTPWLVKIRASGEPVWSQTFAVADNADAEFTDIIHAQENTYLLAGSSGADVSLSAADRYQTVGSGWAMKLSPTENGVEERWRSSMLGDGFHSLAARDSGAIVVGSKDGSGYARGIDATGSWASPERRLDTRNSLYRAIITRSADSILVGRSLKPSSTAMGGIVDIVDSGMDRESATHE